jgi:hypothetical protein
MNIQLTEAQGKLDALAGQEKIGRISTKETGFLRQEVMLYCNEPLPVGTAVYLAAGAQGGKV